MILTRMLQLRKASAVVRYHNVPWVGARQSLADHSYGVVVILTEIAEPADLTVELLKYAAHHDLHECIMGDIPAPTMWSVHANWGALEAASRRHMDVAQEFVGLSGYHRQLVKLADVLEGVFTAFDQVMLGNIHAHPIMERWIHRLETKGLLKCSERGTQLFCRLKGAYQRVRQEDQVKIRIFQDLPELDFWQHSSALGVPGVPSPVTDGPGDVGPLDQHS